jgi:hypothetical protein
MNHKLINHPLRFIAFFAEGNYSSYHTSLGEKTALHYATLAAKTWKGLVLVENSNDLGTYHTIENFTRE